MSIRILLIAAAALICHCAADVAHINQAAPKDVLVPFNDLLPPPLEESTTETATLATKPTKKSFHQQQPKQYQHQQQQVRNKESASSAVNPPVLQLAVDLLPPFADADSGSSSSSSTTTTTTTTSTTRQPLVSIKPASTVAPRVAQAVQVHARVPARTNSLGSETFASSRFSPELIHQYATYFQSTTPHPPRGPLPTLTPFPHYVKI